MPSPILPDGTMVPLPIPSGHDLDAMRDVHFLPGVDLDGLLNDLSKGRHGPATTVHLDPDLSRHKARMPKGWRPSLGQTGQAQTHLYNQGVTKGDLFLFYGWFRRVEQHEGGWRYARSAPHIHALYGWLEVGDVLAIVQDRVQALRDHPWIALQPHVRSPAHYDNPRNTLYIAPKKTRLAAGGHGGGRFPRFSPELCLTKEGASRSVWRLPDWFMPRNRTPLSYHTAPGRWQREGKSVILRTVPKGQEFVLDGQHYPELGDWARDLIRRHA